MDDGALDTGTPEPPLPPERPEALLLAGCFPSLVMLVFWTLKPVWDYLEDYWDEPGGSYAMWGSVAGAVVVLGLFRFLKIPRALLRTFTVLGALVVVFVLMNPPGFIRARGQGQLTACRSNLKNLSTAMEMYSTDNGGRYPASLAALTPNYLKVIPACPSSRFAAYAFTSVTEPDAYTVVCHDSHHKRVGVPNEYPQYSSYAGLINP